MMEPLIAIIVLTLVIFGVVVIGMKKIDKKVEKLKLPKKKQGIILIVLGVIILLSGIIRFFIELIKL